MKTIPTPKVILAILSHKKLIPWNLSYLKYALNHWNIFKHNEDQQIFISCGIYYCQKWKKTSFHLSLSSKSFSGQSKPKFFQKLKKNQAIIYRLNNILIWFCHEAFWKFAFWWVLLQPWKEIDHTENLIYFGNDLRCIYIHQFWKFALSKQSISIGLWIIGQH